MSNLEQAKEIAKEWLNIPIESAPIIVPGIISHPFFSSPFVQDKDGVFLMQDDPERAEGVISDIEKIIDMQNDLTCLLNLINKPYCIGFLADLYEDNIADEKDCGNTLGQIWPMLENNDSTDMETKELMLYWLLAAEKDVIMDKDNLSVFNGLPKQVTAYRGIQPGEPEKGFSWSLDLKTAKWFSKRFGYGKVYSADINKKDIIAYTNSRGEQEIIVNYNNIGKITEI